MKTNILRTIVNRIKENRFNFENVMKKGSYYGNRCNINPLFCSYGQIGYAIYTDFGEIEFDFEMNKINVYAN